MPCDVMWCYVTLTHFLPQQPVAVLGWLSHIIHHGPLQVRSCHQSWSSSLACSFWLLPLLPSEHQGLLQSLPTPRSCYVTANTSDMHEMELWRAWGIVKVYRYGQQIHIDMSKWLLRMSFNSCLTFELRTNRRRIMEQLATACIVSQKMLHVYLWDLKWRIV